MQFAKLYSSVLAATALVAITNGFLPQASRGSYSSHITVNLRNATPNGEEGGDTDRDSHLETNTAVNKGTCAVTGTTGTTGSETNADLSLSTFSRRKCVRSIFDCALFAVGSFAGTKEASANLVQFPVTYDMMNTYHVMRAGESILDQQDIISTNQLFL